MVQPELNNCPLKIKSKSYFSMSQLRWVRSRIGLELSSESSITYKRSIVFNDTSNLQQRTKIWIINDFHDIQCITFHNNVLRVFISNACFHSDVLTIRRDGVRKMSWWGLSQQRQWVNMMRSQHDISKVFLIINVSLIAS